MVSEGFALDVFQNQRQMVVNRLVPQRFSNPLDRIEGPSHFIFSIQQPIDVCG